VIPGECRKPSWAESAPQVLLAMQTVVGSNPISRFMKRPAFSVFVDLRTSIAVLLSRSALPRALVGRTSAALRTVD
jgi:hypothetical protein